ncbi:MAG: NlpC/P60 family protein [Bacteroidota bacterium]
MKHPGLVYLFLFVAFFAVACKSKKGTTVSKRKELSRKEREYKLLSEKLNLPLTDSDNVKLYSFVADWLGTPHQMGKCTKEAVDCSCYVRLMYEEVYGKTIPRSSKEMFDASSRLNNEELQEGDLVFFNIKTSKVSHVGVYLKEGWFAHVSTSKGVMINNLSEKYYAKYYLRGGRLKGS